MVWLSVVAASHLLRSLRTAALVMRLLVGRRQTETELLAVRQGDAHQEAAGTAVAQRRIVESRMIAGLERLLGPAGTGENAGARDFEHPSLRGGAVLGIGLDDKGDVRIGPVHRLDGAFHGAGMLRVIRRTGMMRGRNAAEAEKQAGRYKDNFRRHHCVISSSFGC